MKLLLKFLQKLLRCPNPRPTERILTRYVR